MKAIQRNTERSRRGVSTNLRFSEAAASSKLLEIRPPEPIHATPRLAATPRCQEDRLVITPHRLSNGPPALPKTPVARRLRSAWVRVSQYWCLGLALTFLGGLLGYLFTTKICIPLFRVEASIEVQNAGSDAHTQALGHMIESQWLISRALTSLSETDQGSLMEPPRFPMFLLKSLDPNQTLQGRLTAKALPGANVIDITFDSPNPVAAEHFVNALIRSLAQTNEQLEPRPSTNRDTGPEASEHLPESAPHAKSVRSIIDPAIATGDPVSPNALLNVSAGAFCGWLFAIGVALARKFGWKTLSGPGSAGDVLGVRELGALTESEPVPAQAALMRLGADTPSLMLQIEADDEALRHLRSSLLYHPNRQKTRCLAFTSSSSNEGKTVVVAKLAMSLAATGRRVLVVDGDLRRGPLHKLMQVHSSPGLADLLRRLPDHSARYVVGTSFQNLFVLPPGTAGEDASELLEGSLLAILMREFMELFDVVLVDTPPLLGCGDARRFALSVDGAVLVVHSSGTQKREALRMRDVLLQDGVNIIGTVLTGCVDAATPAYQYATT